MAFCCLPIRRVSELTLVPQQIILLGGIASDRELGDAIGDAKPAAGATADRGGVGRAQSRQSCPRMSIKLFDQKALAIAVVEASQLDIHVASEERQEPT